MLSITNKRKINKLNSTEEEDTSNRCWFGQQVEFGSKETRERNINFDRTLSLFDYKWTRRTSFIRWTWKWKEEMKKDGK